MILAVADSSVLVAFSAIRRLDVLRAVVSQILIPGAVRRELIDQGVGWIEARDAQAAILSADWIEVENIKALEEMPKTRLGLFTGESEAIPLAELHGCPILLDDPRARRAALERQLLVVGSLGMLVLAKRARVVSEIAPLVYQMKREGIRFRDDLIERSLREVGEM